MRIKMEKEKINKKGKEGLIDTLGMITYSILWGGTIDYLSGLNISGIIASRTTGTLSNLPTAAPYGKYRNYLYKKTKTTDKSSTKRKYLTELLAFNTFQVPLYTIVLTLASLTENYLSDRQFKVDLDKVGIGTAILAGVSPAVGPVMGLWMEGFRKMFGLKSAPKKAGESLENKLN